MNIEKLFNYLNNNKKLILYLFEHRDRVISLSEIDFVSEVTLENLVIYEIIDITLDKIALDYRVINFLEEYIDNNEIVDIAIIGSILEKLEHLILQAQEFKTKQKSNIPKIRRYVFKIDNLLFKNLEKLRTHINMVYKSIDEFKIKLKELEFYKDRLNEFEIALASFDKFLQKYTPLLNSFLDNDLNKILNFIKINKIEIFKTLIPLTQDVISYINKLEYKNIFIEKVVKLKELKDAYELNTKTNLKEVIEKFDILENSIKIYTKLDSDILETDEFRQIVKKVSNKKIKRKIANSINIEKNIKTNEIFYNIYLLHRQFISTNQSLIEFLVSNEELKNIDFSKIAQIFCRMILMYEDEYNITDTKITINNINFAKVYHR